MAALRFDISQPDPAAPGRDDCRTLAVSDARSGARVGQLVQRRGRAWEPDDALREAAGLDEYFRTEYRGRVTSFGDLYPGRPPGGYLQSVIIHVRAAYDRRREASRPMAAAAARRAAALDPPARSR